MSEETLTLAHFELDLIQQMLTYCIRQTQPHPPEELTTTLSKIEMQRKGNNNAQYHRGSKSTGENALNRQERIRKNRITRIARI